MRDSRVTRYRARLDDDFASPLLFSLMAALQDDAELEFRTLRRVLQCEGAALSGAIGQLAAARHLAVRRASFGEAAGTWIFVTAVGQTAFAEHLQALREIAAEDGRSS